MKRESNNLYNDYIWLVYITNNTDISIQTSFLLPQRGDIYIILPFYIESRREFGASKKNSEHYPMNWLAAPNSVEK